MQHTIPAREVLAAANRIIESVAFATNPSGTLVALRVHPSAA